MIQSNVIESTLGLAKVTYSCRLQPTKVMVLRDSTCFAESLKVTCASMHRRSRTFNCNLKPHLLIVNIDKVNDVWIASFPELTWRELPLAPWEARAGFQAGFKDSSRSAAMCSMPSLFNNFNTR